MTRERALPLTGPQVLAVLAGRKTQHRTPLKPQPETFMVNGKECKVYPLQVEGREWLNIAMGETESCGVITSQKLPHQVGDELFAQETFVLECTVEYHGEIEKPTDRPIQEYTHWDGDYWLIPHYRATEPEPNITASSEDDTTKWSPSTQMPKWASRIWLRVTEIRVERLQDISEEDATAEGIFRRGAVGDDPMHPEWTWQKSGFRYDTPHEAYHALWNAQHEKRGHGWDQNDWVLVREFESVER